MISAKSTLTHLGFSIDSPLRVTQEVREIIESSNTPTKRASKLIFDVTGLDQQFTDPRTAINVAQYVISKFVANDSYDEHLALAEAIKKSEAVRKDLPWAYAKPEYAAGRGETVEAAVEGIETKVAIKADGSIKKGGKQILAAELYKKYVTDAPTPASNREFVDILVTQLGMTKSGATTYSFNCRKSAGAMK